MLTKHAPFILQETKNKSLFALVLLIQNYICADNKNNASFYMSFQIFNLPKNI